MPDENLTPEERGELLKLLRDTIAADRFPLSQRIRKLKSALAKIDPAAAPAPAAGPFPAPIAWVNSTVGQRKGPGRR
jgi:hypothetical protein